ncbi:MAG TPA: DNA repair protein RadA [Alphaproteobacteria bacterium]|nr:DNA repair protein RadA [Alphaproteobacteria bacterium]
MAKASPRYICQACGQVAPKWSGKCDACGEWNSFAQEAAESVAAPQNSLGSAKGGRVIPLVPLDGETTPAPRILTGISELDRVAGGGLVPGSAILLGGDPGIGKSTLVLQLLASLAKRHQRAIYVSGEEGVEQVRMRGLRLGLSEAPVELAAETSLRDILATLEAGPAPAILAIDSVQTLWSDLIEAAPGTVSQVRAAALDLIRYAKRRGVCLILVGHVTKDGQIAGPRVLEHMVDAVFYFEGERGHQFRILRGVKNRFGATDEIGVFEMTDKGLAEVPNPSALFLGPRDQRTAGAAVFAGMEGTRPILVEIQALVAQAAYGAARRAVVGWDAGRLAMILAVLDARAALEISGNDVYLNVAGGMRIQEPAADLAAAGALVSSFLGTPIAPDCILFGEIRLSGAIRPVSHAEARVKEAAKLGFRTVIGPPMPSGQKSALPLTPVATVTDLLTVLRS